MSSLSLAIAELNKIVSLPNINLSLQINLVEQQKNKFSNLSKFKDIGNCNNCIKELPFVLQNYCVITPPNQTGIIVLGTKTVTTTTATIPFTYTGNDATGFTYSVNLASPSIPVESSNTTSGTIYLTSLTPNTQYNVAIYATGTSQFTSTLFTTESNSGNGTGNGVGNGGTIVFGNPTLTQTSILQPFTYTGVDNITGYLIKKNGVIFETQVTSLKTSFVLLQNLEAYTDYEISVTPLKIGGAGLEVNTTPKTLPYPPAGTFSFNPIEFSNIDYDLNTYTATNSWQYSGQLHPSIKFAWFFFRLEDYNNLVSSLTPPVTYAQFRQAANAYFQGEILPNVPMVKNDIHISEEPNLPENRLVFSIWAFNEAGSSGSS